MEKIISMTIETKDQSVIDDISFFFKKQRNEVLTDEEISVTILDLTINKSQNKKIIFSLIISVSTQELYKDEELIHIFKYCISKKAPQLNEFIEESSISVA